MLFLPFSARQTFDASLLSRFTELTGKDSSYECIVLKKCITDFSAMLWPQVLLFVKRRMPVFSCHCVPFTGPLQPVCVEMKLSVNPHLILTLLKLGHQLLGLFIRLAAVCENLGKLWHSQLILKYCCAFGSRYTASCTQLNVFQFVQEKINTTLSQK